MSDDQLTEDQNEIILAAQKAFFEVIGRHTPADDQLRMRLAAAGATRLLAAVLVQRPILAPVLADAINPRLSEVGWQFVPIAKH